MVDLQYSIDGKSVSVEGSHEAGLDDFWRHIYADVAHALGDIYTDGEMEKDPGLPSDPEITLWWDGKNLTDSDP